MNLAASQKCARWGGAVGGKGLLRTWRGKVSPVSCIAAEDVDEVRKMFGHE